MPYCTGVFMAVPAYNRVVTADTALSLINLTLLLRSEGIKCGAKFLGCADIVDLRNILLTQWYYQMPQASHMLFVDADMGFEPYLVWDMISFGKPLTGVLYAKRQLPCQVVGKCFSDDDTIDDTQMGHLKVAGVGGGVMLITRPVVKGIIEKFPELIDKTVQSPIGGMARDMDLPHLIRAFKPHEFENGDRLSEDLSFCWRWRECGGEVWANIHHPIHHIGPFDFSIRYGEYLEAKKKQKDEAAAKNTAEPESALVIAPDGTLGKFDDPTVFTTESLVTDTPAEDAA